MNFEDIIKFILFITFAFFIPGWLLVSKLSIKDLYIKLYLSVISAITIFTLTSFALGYLNIRGLLQLIIPISLLLVIFYRKKFVALKKIKFNKVNLITIIIILAGVIFQNSITFRTGLLKDFGIGFWGPLGRDGVWHLSLSSELINNFPPQNPALAGNVLYNYHFFYNLLIAESSILTGINVSDLIFRFYPILFSLLLGLGTYLLASKLFNDRKSAVFSVFFVYFGSSFGWFLELIKSGRPIGGESSFWSNQAVSMNLNPPFAISLLLLVGIILSLSEYIRNNNKKLAVVLILLGGSIIEFKVYAGVIVLFGLFILAIKKLIDRDFRIFFIFILSLLLSFILFYPQNKNSQNLLVLAPFWMVNTMIQFEDRVGWVKLSSAINTYIITKSLPKLIVAEILALTIFIIGNIGTKVLVIFSIKKIFTFFIEKDIHLYILSLSAISAIVPLIFIQKGNSWNIIQFFYYFLFLLSFYAGFTLAKIYSILPIKINNLFILLILFVTPISSYFTFKSGLYSKPVAIISAFENAGLDFLSNQKDGVILVPPFDTVTKSRYKDPYPLFAYAPNTYVSAYSGKKTYLEDVDQQIILQTNFNSRLLNVNKFFYTLEYDWQRNFLRDENIKYIYLPRGYNILLNEEALEIIKIFENYEVYVYEVI